MFSESARAVVASTVVGQSHLIGPQEVRARQSTKPAAEPTRPQTYDAIARLASSDAALAEVGGGEWLAVRVSPRPGSRAVPLPGELACSPAVMGEGVLTPLAIGQVHLLDLAGQPLATPFQPRVAAGSRDQPPDQQNRTDRRHARAGRPMQDRGRHARPPAPDREVR